MKNIHVLPTPKPSRLHEYDYLSPMRLSKEPLKWRLGRNIYITNDEEIKEGDWCLFNRFPNVVSKATSNMSSSGSAKKIILTDNTKLIKNGVQAIPDEFLEWFVKNPSCEEVEVEQEILKLVHNPNYVNHTPNGDGIYLTPKSEDLQYGETLIEDNVIDYKIIIPKEEPKQENCCTPIGQIKRYINCKGCDRKPKQETLEEAINREFPFDKSYKEREAMFIGAKYQQEQDKNKYSEEDIEEYAEYCTTHVLTTQIGNPYLSIKDWCKQIKKK